MVEEKISNNNSSTLYELFVEWCENTTIHGVKYLGERGRFIAERLCWIIVFALSFIMCGKLIHNLWLKWTGSPSIVTFSEVPTAIWEVPFPAVTICPEYKYRMSEFNTTTLITGQSQSYTKEEIKTIVQNMIALSMVCSAQLKKEVKRNFYSKKSIEILKQLALKANETFFSCDFRQDSYKPCENVFSEILTEEGVCFTYNLLDFNDIFRDNVEYHYSSHGIRATDWSLQNGYSNNASFTSFPYRSFNSGMDEGLDIILQLNPDDRNCYCRFPLDGFKVSFHSPNDIPKMIRNFFWIPNLNYQLIGVKPRLIKTSDSLIKYDPFKRHCFFEAEKYLQFFKVYSQSNCELECLVNKTLEMCDCVAFYMPKMANMKICGTNKVDCIKNATMAIVNSQFKQAEEKFKNFPCSCLPECTTVSYDIEMSNIDWKWREYVTFLRLENELSSYYITGVQIFFQTNHFLAAERIELYGVTDLIANIGGLLGLFMGVSALSIVEILYFFTLRFICNLKIKKKSTDTEKNL